MNANFTDWNAYRLDDIWAMLRGESRSRGEVATDAWRRTAQLCDEQADQLQRALQQLAERWPTTQPAAVAFQTWAGSLITSMRVSAEVADNNRQVLSTVTGQLASTVDAIARLKGQAEHNLNLEDDRRNAPTIHVGAISEYDGPIAPDNWQADLDQQAREIMRRNEAIIVAEASRVLSPRMVRSDSGGIDVGDEIEEAHIRTGLEPGWRTGSVPSTTPYSGQWPLGASTADDPVLDGATSFAPVRSGEDGVQGGGGLGGPTSGGLRGGSPLVDTPVGPALAPGGVIGGNRPAGPGSPGQRAVPTSNLNARTGPTPGGLAPMVPPMMAAGRPGQSGGAAGGIGASARRRPHHPDDQWTIPAGGPAVIVPKPDPVEHDPGPGVIGIDR